MDFYLLILGIFIACLGYGIYIVYYFIYHKDLLKDINGFDMAKEITSDYDSINVVESQGLYSKYYLNRKVIKLTPRVYSSSDIFSLTLVAILSSISLLNNKYIKFMSRFLPFISFCDKSSIVMVILSLVFYSKGDARIGIILGIIILVYQYCYRQIIYDSTEICRDKIKIKKEEFSIIMGRICSSHTLFFISSLIFLLRFILIVMY